MPWAWPAGLVPVAQRLTMWPRRSSSAMVCRRKAAFDVQRVARLADARSGRTGSAASPAPAGCRARGRSWRRRPACGSAAARRRPCSPARPTACRSGRRARRSGCAAASCRARPCWDSSDRARSRRSGSAAPRRCGRRPPPRRRRHRANGSAMPRCPRDRRRRCRPCRRPGCRRRECGPTEAARAGSIRARRSSAYFLEISRSIGTSAKRGSAR